MEKATMTRSTVFVSLSVGLLALTSWQPARADYVSAGGGSCHPVYGSRTNVALWGEYGIGNFDTTNELVVNCPINLGKTPSSSVTVNSVTLRFRDNSPKPMSCRIAKRGYDGVSMAWAVTKYGCATPGGCTNLYSCNPSTGSCTDVVSSYQGTNYLSWSASELGFNNYYIDQTVTITCYIPPSRSSSPGDSEQSQILAYMIQ
jgi:hypothetical protein